MSTDTLFYQSKYCRNIVLFNLNSILWTIFSFHIYWYEVRMLFNGMLDNTILYYMVFFCNCQNKLPAKHILILGNGIYGIHWKIKLYGGLKSKLCFFLDNCLQSLVKMDR